MAGGGREQMVLMTDNRGVLDKADVAVLMARLVDRDGAKLEPAIVRSIKYSLYELDAERHGAYRPAAGHDGIALNVLDVIFNKLQRDDGWAIDNVGYNFCHRISTGNLDESFRQRGARYEMRYEITLTTGVTTFVCFRVRMVPT